MLAVYIFFRTTGLFNFIGTSIRQELHNNNLNVQSLKNVEKIPLATTIFSFYFVIDPHGLSYLAPQWNGLINRNNIYCIPGNIIRTA
ncbi:hypothetical protein QNM32_03040 [Chitinophagaceae bacterium DXS]|nr:hypothetical protein QNM32_03040 [Chitinophagaceae bacterium DXS]